MSRLKAVWLISKWCRTSQETVSVSHSLRPRRGPRSIAILAPISEWSPPRPLAMSCNSTPRYIACRDCTSPITE